MTDNAGDAKRPKTLRPLWYRIGRIIAIGYLTVLVTLLVLESRLVYPGAYQAVDAREVVGVETTAEPFEYQSADGTRLIGQLVRRGDAVENDGKENSAPPRYLVFFHGNGTKAIWSRGFIERLSAATGATVLAAEYRGFGADRVRLSESGVVADSVAAVDSFCDALGIKPQDVFVYGSSLGGGCAAAVARQRPVKGVILERSFDRLVDVAAGMYPYMPVRWLMRNRFDSIARLKDFRGPVLQIHGDVDVVVPIHHAKRLQKALTTKDQTFIERQGLGHNDSIDDVLLRQVGDWMGARAGDPNG